MFNTKTDTPKKTDERPAQEDMPVGTHKAKVVFTKTGESSTGKARIDIKFQNDAEQVIWYNLYAPLPGGNPKHIKVVHHILTSLRLDGIESVSVDDVIVALNNQPDEVAGALLGAEGVVTVVDEKWNGQVRRKATWVDSLAPF